MQRSIRGFHRDDAGDWVAELDCGHGQHVRHTPPFSSRPWVESEAGRQERIGQPLACVLCDRRELPADWVAYRRSPIFDEASIPQALRSRHGTKAGVWARIHVLEGRLRYRLHAPFDEEQILDSAKPGVVLPGVEHEVEPLGPVRFYLEFHQRAKGSGATTPA